MGDEYILTHANSSPGLARSFLPPLAPVAEAKTTRDFLRREPRRRLFEKNAKRAGFDYPDGEMKVFFKPQATANAGPRMIGAAVALQPKP